ncbi:MAG: hypothetical protein NTU72_12405 [Fimbriimonadales bacterium]|nr:hypothetical protein [Fimbriimonadales bacterium]
MSLTVLSCSRAFRAMSLFMAATLTYNASAAGWNALAFSAAAVGGILVAPQIKSSGGA